MALRANPAGPSDKKLNRKQGGPSATWLGLSLYLILDILHIYRRNDEQH